MSEIEAVRQAIRGYLLAPPEQEIGQNHWEHCDAMAADILEMITNNVDVGLEAWRGLCPRCGTMTERHTDVTSLEENGRIEIERQCDTCWLSFYELVPTSFLQPETKTSGEDKKSND